MVEVLTDWALEMWVRVSGSVGLVRIYVYMCVYKKYTYAYMKCIHVRSRQPGPRGSGLVIGLEVFVVLGDYGSGCVGSVTWGLDCPGSIW